MNMLCSVDNLLGTTIAPQMPVLKMMFFFQRWDMLVPWVSLVSIRFQRGGDPNIKVPKEEVALWSKLKGHIQTGCFYGICCLPFNEGHVLGHGLTSWVGIRGSSTDLRRYMRYFRMFQTISPNKTISKHLLVSVMLFGHRTLCWSGDCYTHFFDQFCGRKAVEWIGVIAIRPTNCWTPPNWWAKAAILFSSFLRSLLVLSCRMYVNNQWLWAVNY